MFKKIFNDEAGVSPIVATLVLVVVAIAGAAAVGTIMGSFSSDVSDEASAADATSAASTELLIAGSTTVQPVSELLAEAYMDEHNGIKVTVQGGGSGAGITSTELDIIDIGSASKPVDTTTDHPDLQVHQIGGSAVVVIANGALEGYNTTQAELFAIYSNCTDGKSYYAISGSNFTSATSGSQVTVYQRSEASGTEETFAKYLDGAFGDAKDVDDSEALGAVGNAGVLAAVEDTTNSIGFVDFGFAVSSESVTIVGVDGYNDVTEDNVLDCLAGKDTYQEDLTRPLNYLTNGNPSTVEQSFINFAMSPVATQYFEDVGYFSIIDFS
ncbi:phosphate ABC transporter substrate-binding protein, PhoT family [Methanolobus tindarius DSM 2278]|uniref:Phosphate ABC transporter substrate-binding protein, PhoT family n=1 Tax=Methanolobus tindarius DSM 2278 TaxID=1090322 RepID=W9DRA0_METTI|nr:PstS family phosphate ABC transporter substrate-binding protein [Methanolobus tindarius]ETA69259.1 phosphate ABC transporter substrate-binding protein, PhoT family [Methanolobus tindarius DSM 2278]